MASVLALVSLAGTANAASYTTNSFTPTANDLLYGWFAPAAQMNTDWTVTDSLGGSGTKVARAVRATSANFMELWVRDSLAPASSMTVTFSHAIGNATGMIMVVYGVAGMTRLGSAAVRQFKVADNQAAGTPAVTFAAAALTGNRAMGAVDNATHPATLTPPTGWTEPATHGDRGHANPTHGQESCYRDSGFTGTTITWGIESASAFGAIIAELDTSASVTMRPSIGAMTHYF